MLASVARAFGGHLHGPEHLGVGGAPHLAALHMVKLPVPLRPTLNVPAVISFRMAGAVTPARRTSIRRTGPGIQRAPSQGNLRGGGIPVRAQTMFAM